MLLRIEYTQEGNYIQVGTGSPNLYIVAQIIDEFNALYPKKMEAVLALLYRQFGMTPDVLL